ncbi:MAG: alpha,alpha-trehalase TreF [Saprospiraceae bacterium]|nr:alpha,alpha-trehalase TreF [Saprospiraceae bacterium]
MNRCLFLLLSILLITACEPEPIDYSEFYDSELFAEVQMNQVFPDGKTFVDCNPKQPLANILALYEDSKKDKKFDLTAFVNEHFELPVTPDTGFASDDNRSMNAHIQNLWTVLTRNADAANDNSSLIPLPKSYIVPGGRFREIYYWDSYFTLEGLMVSGEEAMAKNMVDNFASLIDSIGFIPNGNRKYYLTRSQPPFFSLMVNRISRQDPQIRKGYLSQLEKEYAFWMQADKVVELDGASLNRFWDAGQTPRPESYREDYEIGHVLPKDEQAKKYKDLRSGAESGWDYSSRWFADKKSIETIETTDIIPVDLNCLLYFLEVQISMAASGEDAAKAKLYSEKAQARKAAINQYLWDEDAQFFIDYNYVKEQPTGVLSLAGAYPLFFNIADQEQADQAIEVLFRDFLKPGGLVTTLNNTGQQWDYPNGWAPLQWMGVKGMLNYGYEPEAREAATRWLNINEKVYANTGKMMEKYNVVDTTLLAGGGEYPNQDGFGWTNGIALALQDLFKEE